MKKWGKAFQAEESGYTKAWEHKGACLPPEIDGTCLQYGDTEGGKKQIKLAGVTLWMLSYVLL